MPLPSSNLRRARPLLGTLVEIGARGDPAVLPAAVEGAFAAIERVHRLMSFHDPASDVSRLNGEAHLRPVAVDQRTWAVLAHAQRIAAASDGAFDVTVAPPLVRWGYLPESRQPLPTVRPNGYRSIELLAASRVRFRAPLLIDLGGIAKGYAVDLACEALEACGVTDYVVNAGGDLRVGATPTLVEVRHPGQPATTLALGTIRRAAIATSGRYYAGRTRHEGAVHPIVVPATAGCARYSGSISVRATDCATADALTKVVAILGNRSGPVLGRFGAEAALLASSGAWRALPAGGRASRAPDRRRGVATAAA
jgi:thiamine biosynthesis lipoprotein